MIIGIGPNVTLITPGQRDSSELADQQKREADLRGKVSLQGDSRSERVDPDAFKRRIDALQASADGRLQRQREKEELPLGNQQALELYRSNQFTPISDDDDNELAGVDVFI